MERTEPTEGASVGRYRLLRELGVGGMATVYLAELEGAGGFRREVALKILHPHLRRDPKIVEAFLREAQLAARLRHDRVVSVSDVGEGERGVYMVMDYVRGVALSEILSRTEGSRRRRLGLRALLDALEGLHAAHELQGEGGEPSGLVHRDFSPQNILVAEEGTAHLSDFGIARTARGVPLTTQPVVKGKLPYIAPEQARAEAIDRRTDVWAAGVLAWEILAGEPMYGTALGSTPALLTRIATEPAPALPDVGRTFSPALVDAVDWALRFDPAERCPDADSLRRALLDSLEAGALASREELAKATRLLRASPRDDAACASTRTAPPVVESQPELPSPGRRRRRGPVLAVLGAVAACVLVLATRGSDSAPAAAEAPVSPAPVAPTPEIAPRDEAPPQRVLQVISDTPLAAISVDDSPQTIEVGTEATTLSVRADAERLRATNQDGREVEVSIEGPGVLLRFGPGRRPRRTMAPMAPEVDTELAGNPYE